MWLPEDAGLHFPPGCRERGASSHAVMGQAIFETIVYDAIDEIAETDGNAARYNLPRDGVRTVSSLIGCHHGKPSTKKGVHDASKVHCTATGLSESNWYKVQRELFDFALRLSDYSWDELLSVCSTRIAPQIASLLSGALIMCDWIASNTDCFPLISLPYVEDTGYGKDWDEECGEGELRADDPDLSLDFLRARGLQGWCAVDLTPPWTEEPLGEDIARHLIEKRFELPAGAAPHPVQRKALEVALGIEEPGIMVIEAPMGEGKTEAALAVAEVFAAKTGAGGVCVALPTMATTDAMFGRVHRWIECLPRSGRENDRSICLAHGKARLNEEYQGITRQCSANWDEMVDQDRGAQRTAEVDRESAAVVSGWMSGRKRGMLANFVVCTIDQVLMGALQMKHLALRQLALANKVIVIDECHAYDMYMRQYLDDILGWFGSWRVPVILLSATLPSEQREEMIKAYVDGRKAKRAERRRSLRRSSVVRSEPMSTVKKSCLPSGTEYPIISYSDGAQVKFQSTGFASRSFSVELCCIDDGLDSLLSLIKDLTVEGGCVGVVCDTVSRAQAVVEMLGDEFGKEAVTLSHARFIDIDRMENEKYLREILGPTATRDNGKRPDFHVVVGTQVLEQSLDIDFDVLVTDVAPVDMLLQRMGRCHRHSRSSRPARLRGPRCFIRGIDAWDEDGPRFANGISAVYDQASLIESLSVCHIFDGDSSSTFTLPDDIAHLVQFAYSGDAVRVVPDRWSQRYERACVKRDEAREQKRERARCCLLRPAADMIREGASLTDWYQLSTTDKTDGDYGPRAVRDTQETVEVMLLRHVDGNVRLLPWIGDARRGVEAGAAIPTDVVPDKAISLLAVQSCVRLPISICSMDRIEELIGALEKMDEPFVGAWQDSPWLAGELALLLEEKGGHLETMLDLGPTDGVWQIRYARSVGLTVCRMKY